MTRRAAARARSAARRNGGSPSRSRRWRLSSPRAARGSTSSRATPSESILALAAAANASRVLWSRRYEGGATALDARVKAALRERGVEAHELQRPPACASRGSSPRATARRSASFPPSGGAIGRLGPLPAPTPAPERLIAAPWPREAPERVSIERSSLDPTKPDWSGELGLGETPGEAGALAALETFADRALRRYADERDLLAPGAASRLSANLRFGEISPRRVAHAVETAAAADPALARAAEKYMAELGWRDFAAALLYAHPDLATRPLRARVRALSLA